MFQKTTRVIKRRAGSRGTEGHTLTNDVVGRHALLDRNLVGVRDVRVVPVVPVGVRARHEHGPVVCVDRRGHQQGEDEGEQGIQGHVRESVWPAQADPPILLST